MDPVSMANLITQLFILDFAKISVFYLDSKSGLCKVLLVEKKLLKVVNNAPTIWLWRSLTCQNSHPDISTLISVDISTLIQTWLKAMHALLPKNVFFLENF